jgi:type IV pilus biogenesis protein CpaD/CtpE
MTVIIEPHAEFRSLTEAEIEKALADPNPDNPIAVEIARLVQGYTANFHVLVQRLGRIPTDIMHVKPRSPIEAVAMRLTTQTIREIFAQGG